MEFAYEDSVNYGETTWKIEEPPIGFDRQIENDSLFRIRMKKNIINQGLGVSIYLGLITFHSGTSINFHSKSLLQALKDNIKTIKFDVLFEGLRREPIFQKEKFVSTFAIFWKYYIPLDGEHSFYSTIFYRDQHENLYSTTHLDYIRLKNVELLYKEEFSLIEILDTNFPNEFYHPLSFEDEIEINNVLLSIDDENKLSTYLARKLFFNL